MLSSGKISRRTFVLASMGTCVAASSGCGLLIYPERKGQPAGRLDWGVVLLDGLGLLLFVLPGVIAFAVDFATGTIYLPPEPQWYGSESKTDGELVAVEVPRDRLTKLRVEQVVSSHAGRPVHLVDGKYQAEQIGSVKEFWEAVNRISARASAHT